MLVEARSFGDGAGELLKAASWRRRLDFRPPKHQIGGAGGQAGDRGAPGKPCATRAISAPLSSKDCGEATGRHGIQRQ
jgi:hypothetical protein